MSTLVVQIPERPAPERAWRRRPELRAGHRVRLRQHQRRPDDDRPGRGAAPRCCPRRPRSSRLADTDVSWHRITLPKAPAAPARALVGVPRKRCWPTRKRCTSPSRRRLGPGPTDLGGGGRPRLAARRTGGAREGQRLRRRIVPASWPDDPPSGHFAETRADAAAPEQACCLGACRWRGQHPLQGGLARALVPRPPPPAPGAPRRRRRGRPSSGWACRST